jgi:hypothetical protein
MAVLAISYASIGHALYDTSIISHVPLSWDDFTLVIHSIYNAATVIISSLSADYSDLRDSMVRTFSHTDSFIIYFSHLTFVDSFHSNTAIDYAVTSLAASSMLGESPLLAGQLGPYLAGLLEADGSFSTPAILGQGTPTIYISFNLDDLPYGKFLQSLLGGSIQLEAHAHAFRLVFRSTEYVLNIINLVNGYMRTPKIEALHTMVE